MSESVADWLRAELAADLDAMQSRTLTEWARVAVDTVFMPGLVARTAVHSCAYAINHGKLGAETTFSLFERPIRAEWWRTRDDLQASVLSALSVGWLATPYASVPADPALAAVVWLAIVPLLVDPLQALMEVGR